MVSGTFLKKFVVNGLSVMAFFIVMKTFVAPRLPAGGQKLISAA